MCALTVQIVTLLLLKVIYSLIMAGLVQPLSCNIQYVTVTH